LAEVDHQRLPVFPDRVQPQHAVHFPQHERRLAAYRPGRQAEFGGQLATPLWRRERRALLVFSAADGRLLGGSGLGFESLHQASTGYVLARDAWGLGYATELTGLMVELAAALGVSRLTATCHHAHTASRHVLEKSGFTNDGILPRHVVFPNISRQLQDAYSYSRVIAP
jgi:RimJ/RimL family protein N-acetyltransferase